MFIVVLMQYSLYHNKNSVFYCTLRHVVISIFHPSIPRTLLHIHRGHAFSIFRSLRLGLLHHWNVWALLIPIMDVYMPRSQEK